MSYNGVCTGHTYIKSKEVRNKMSNRTKVKWWMIDIVLIVALTAIWGDFGLVAALTLAYITLPEHPGK